MKVLVTGLLLLSTSVFADPGHGRKKEERQKARVEKQLHRKQHPFDQRTRDEKRRDRNMVIIMALGAGLIVKSMSGE